MMVAVNAALTVLLALVCWWLAHQFAADRKAFGRAIASGYAAMGMLSVFNLLFRDTAELAEGLPATIVAFKAALVLTLGAVSARIEALSRYR